MKNNIRVLRENLGLTQEELAEKVQVTRQTIIALEKGRYNPSLELAYRITKALKKEHIEDVFIFEDQS
ncbi:helix-turn-helix transcriptional regulator [Methanothermobacter tenebrarum]|uniref:Transcriptional regulator n=1 Tax=Methanothermobacter tenebrarum TaxID=680118 RepID=A0A328PAI3_9EURY|nr:helix-turn-helix transcriptional regulator [Methanothermobacter tenebrarum]MBC7100641.1 helix-turn-helix transcriptional regulator [Methanobacteriales archaeon]MBC7118544.1 helix-turn-helix transcriptional regulator [Methanobacteriaceae archaeon]NPV65325.1 helix-turn-helix transcriptional regulator [Methanobacteriaceae archaeon]RAO79677.1 transcriptional regulator [Methanothermobacter tenebrarum]